MMRFWRRRRDLCHARLQCLICSSHLQGLVCDHLYCWTMEMRKFMTKFLFPKLSFVWHLIFCNSFISVTLSFLGQNTFSGTIPPFQHCLWENLSQLTLPASEPPTMLTLGNDCIMLQVDQLMSHNLEFWIHVLIWHNTNTFQQNTKVKMHGKGSLVSDTTMHEDFLYVNFVSFVVMWRFPGFLLQLNDDGKKYDIDNWEKQIKTLILTLVKMWNVVHTLYWTICNICSLTGVKTHFFWSVATNLSTCDKVSREKWVFRNMLSQHKIRINKAAGISAACTGHGELKSKTSTKLYSLWISTNII